MSDVEERMQEYLESIEALNCKLLYENEQLRQRIAETDHALAVSNQHLEAYRKTYSGPIQQPAASITEQDAREIIGALVGHIERNTCLHEETHRGGAIWEICNSCGAKWADDRGGKPEFKWPSYIDDAYTLLNKLNADRQAPEVAVPLGFIDGPDIDGSFKHLGWMRMERHKTFDCNTPVYLASPSHSQQSAHHE